MAYINKKEILFSAAVNITGVECPDTHVIEVDALPDDEAADENAVYLCDGKYYTFKYIAVEGGTVGEWTEYAHNSGESGGGGAELNIAYGDTPPEDTTKLWCKCDEPEAVQIVPPSLVGAEAVATVAEGEGSIETLSTKLPTGAFSIASAMVGTKAYLFGGTASGARLDTIQVFDTKKQELITLNTKLSSGTGNMASALVGTKIYLFGGNSTGGAINTIQVFDTETEALTTLTTTLPSKTININTAVIGTKVYLFGGISNGSFVDTIRVFDTESETLTILSTVIPNDAYGATTATIDNKVYLFGGVTSGNKVNTIRVFDTESETLTTLTTTLPISVNGATTATIDNKVYLFGGNSNNSNNGETNAIQVFDVETQETTTLSATLPTATSMVASEVTGTKIYLFGGTGYLNTINLFNTANSFYLPTNHLLIVESLDKNLFALLPNVIIGIKSVYVGNENNESEQIEAALYQNDNWTNI